MFSLKKYQFIVFLVIFDELTSKIKIKNSFFFMHASKLD
jgi:hypothetical protein